MKASDLGIRKGVRVKTDQGEGKVLSVTNGYAVQWVTVQLDDGKFVKRFPNELERIY